MSYDVIIDDIGRNEWERYASSFSDYNIYQTWAYQQVRGENENQEISRAIVKDGNNNVVTMCQVRVKSVKPLGLRIGYVQWGPLICSKEFQPKSIVTALKELRRAYLGSKVNVLRVVPNVVRGQGDICIEDVLVNCGFQHVCCVPDYHTMILPLEDDEECLRRRLHRSWRRYLKKAEKSDIEIREGTSREYFEILKKLYLLAKKRKRFKGLDPDLFAKTQELLSASEKMNVVVAYYEGQPVTAHITSHLGNTALGILAASNEIALQCNASYLVWWRTLLSGKRAGMKKYDLGGIDPDNNPRVYQFKSRMGTKEAYNIGTFDVCGSTRVQVIWRLANKVHNLVKR